MADRADAQAAKLPFEPSQMVDYGDAGEVTQDGTSSGQVFDNAGSTYTS